MARSTVVGSGSSQQLLDPLQAGPYMSSRRRSSRTPLLPRPAAALLRSDVRARFTPDRRDRRDRDRQEGDPDSITRLPTTSSGLIPCGDVSAAYVVTPWSADHIPTDMLSSTRRDPAARIAIRRRRRRRGSGHDHAGGPRTDGARAGSASRAARSGRTLSCMGASGFTLDAPHPPSVGPRQR